MTELAVPVPKTPHVKTTQDLRVHPSPVCEGWRQKWSACCRLHILLYISFYLWRIVIIGYNAEFLHHEVCEYVRASAVVSRDPDNICNVWTTSFTLNRQFSLIVNEKPSIFSKGIPASQGSCINLCKSRDDPWTKAISLCCGWAVWSGYGCTNKPSVMARVYCLTWPSLLLFFSFFFGWAKCRTWSMIPTTILPWSSLPRRCCVYFVGWHSICYPSPHSLAAATADACTMLTKYSYACSFSLHYGNTIGYKVTG